MEHSLVKFGVHLPLGRDTPWNGLLGMAISAEEANFDAVSAGDHLVAHVYDTIDRKQPAELEGWTVLSALAAKTERLRLIANVSPIPLHHPVRLAKIVTTVDIISSGRAVLGIGTGYIKEEFESFGYQWHEGPERVEMTKEAVEVMLRLWKEDSTSFQGKYYHLDGAPFFPKSVQKPNPPLWFGANSSAMLKEVARVGQGWTYVDPVTYHQEKIHERSLKKQPSLDDFERLTTKLKGYLRLAGRSEGDIAFAPCLTFWPSADYDSSAWTGLIESFKEKGANYILIQLGLMSSDSDSAIKFIRKFGNDVIRSYD